MYTVQRRCPRVVAKFDGEGRAADGNGRPAGIRCADGPPQPGSLTGDLTPCYATGRQSGRQRPRTFESGERRRQDLLEKRGEPGRNRTFNQQIKSRGTSHRTTSQIATFRMNWRLEVAADDASHGRSATQCHTPRRLVPGAAQVGRDSLKRQPFKLEDVVTVDGRPRKTGVGCHASWPTVAHRRGSAAGTQRVSSTSMPPSASAGRSVPGANDSCATRGPRSPSNSCGLKRVHSARSAGGAGVGTAAVGGHHPARTLPAFARHARRFERSSSSHPARFSPRSPAYSPHHACAGTATLGSWRQRRARSRRPGGKAPPVMTRPRHPHRLRPGPGGRG